MKKQLFLLCCFLLVLASCGTKKEDDTVVQEEDESEQEVSIIPEDSLSDNQYKMLLPFKPSEARNTLTNQISNRVDIDEFEQGLRRHSTSTFDPDKYVFEEGQYLDEDTIYDLIEDINPDVDEEDSKEKHEDNPRVFSHVLEQNYLKQNDDNEVDLAGISIGISLKSVYQFETKDGGPYFEDISEKERKKIGEKAAQKALDEIRDTEGLENVPVMIALFSEEEQSSPVPGYFMQKTNVSKDEDEIGKWENITEEHVLVPSDEAKDDRSEDNQKVEALGEEIEDYFPNYVGITGDAFYVDEDLKKLSLELPIEFYGKVEVVGFTQFLYSQVQEIFPNHYDLELTVTSSDGVESVIYQKAGAEKPKVHIFH